MTDQSKARILADENVHPKTIRLLKRKGHDLLSVRQIDASLGGSGLSDEHVLGIACREKRAVLTENVKDFKKLHADWLFIMGLSQPLQFPLVN